MESTPSTKMRRRLSASPLMTGKFEMPPALCTLMPGILVNMVAVSLVATCLLPISFLLSVADVPRLLASDAVAITVIVGR